MYNIRVHPFPACTYIHIYSLIGSADSGKYSAVCKSSITLSKKKLLRVLSLLDCCEGQPFSYKWTSRPHKPIFSHARQIRTWLASTTRLHDPCLQWLSHFVSRLTIHLRKRCTHPVPLILYKALWNYRLLVPSCNLTVAVQKSTTEETNKYKLVCWHTHYCTPALECTCIYIKKLSISD